MDLVEIDVFEAEALQAGGDLIHDVAARQADRVRPRAHPPEHFGRDDDVLALHAEVTQRLPELDLRLAFRIDVGGVDEIDAASSARPTSAVEAFWSSAPIARQKPAPLNVIVPRQISETYWPVLPSGR